MGREGAVQVNDTTPVQITVPEFLFVRQFVADWLKKDSDTREPTRIRQAETLMGAGIIDVPAVLAHRPVAAESTATEGEAE